MKAIILTRGRIAVVDDEDFGAVNSFRWYAQKRKRAYHAARRVNVQGKHVIKYMHQFLMPNTPRVDHKNGDGLDNRRQNLRAATALENSQAFKTKRSGSSSQFRGGLAATLKPPAGWPASTSTDAQST